MSYHRMNTRSMQNTRNQQNNKRQRHPTDWDYAVNQYWDNPPQRIEDLPVPPGPINWNLPLPRVESPVAPPPAKKQRVSPRPGTIEHLDQQRSRYNQERYAFRQLEHRYENQQEEWNEFFDKNPNLRGIFPGEHEAQDRDTATGQDWANFMELASEVRRARYALETHAEGLERAARRRGVRSQQDIARHLQEDGDRDENDRNLQRALETTRVGLAASRAYARDRRETEPERIREQNRRYEVQAQQQQEDRLRQKRHDDAIQIQQDELSRYARQREQLRQQEEQLRQEEIASRLRNRDRRAHERRQAERTEEDAREQRRRERERRERQEAEDAARGRARAQERRQEERLRLERAARRVEAERRHREEDEEQLRREADAQCAGAERRHRQEEQERLREEREARRRAAERRQREGDENRILHETLDQILDQVEDEQDAANERMAAYQRAAAMQNAAAFQAPFFGHQVPLGTPFGSAAPYQGPNPYRAPVAYLAPAPRRPALYPALYTPVQRQQPRRTAPRRRESECVVM